MSTEVTPSTSAPTVWLGGSAAYGGGVGTIQDDYAQLISTAGVFDQSGATVFRMWSGAIDSASERQVNAGIISQAQQQQNFQFLEAIGAYCTANHIVISVEDDFAWTPLWTANWVATAKAAGLPIAYVDGGENLLNVPNTQAALTTLANTMVTDAKVVVDAFPSVQLGDVEPPGTSVSQQANWNNELTNWWTTFDAVAKANSIQGFSYYLADVSWDSAGTGWEPELEQINAAATNAGMQFGLFIDGYVNDVESNQWVAQAQQHLAEVAADPNITPGFVVIESWDNANPDTVTPITASSSMANLALSASLLYPIYQKGLITAVSTFGLQAQPQGVLQLGTNALGGISIQMAASDVAADAQGAVLLVDQTGSLTAVAKGDGQVITNNSNSLLLVGDQADLNKELATLTVTEGSAGPDTLEVETFNLSGLASQAQINLVTLPAGQEDSAGSLSFTNSGGPATWQSSSVSLSAAGAISSESFTWFPASVTATGQYVPTTTVSIYGSSVNRVGDFDGS
jgi:hypothetical protein